MNVGRRPTKLATPFRGALRLLVVYCAVFILIWVFAWMPQNINFLTKCNEAVLDERYSEANQKYIDQDLKLYVECRPLDRALDPDYPCPKLEKFERDNGLKKRPVQKNELYNCYRHTLLDNTSVSVFTWFVGIPFAVLTLIVGWWALKWSAFLITVVAAWIANGFERKS